MTDANWALRNVLIERYDQLMDQLRRRLKSSDLAQDVLHETYLRLGRAKEVEQVQRPVAYLMQIAMNLARDRHVASNRLLSGEQVEAVLDTVADEAPDPAREMEGRSELEAVGRALAMLPARRRAILLAACKENFSTRVIAQQFGLSSRTILLELKLAREFCASQITKSKNN